MATVIKHDFAPKEQIFNLKFTAPCVLKMHKTGEENIALEINKVDDEHGYGEAWVPATSKELAKEKLLRLISIIEFVEN